jgi:hypothetical protein
VSLQAELDAAASRVREIAAKLPQSIQPDMAAEWGRLMRQVEEARSTGAAILAVIEWRQRLERRLSLALLNAPLGVGRDG